MYLELSNRLLLSLHSIHNSSFRLSFLINSWSSLCSVCILLLTIHLIMVRFFMKIIAPRPHLLLLDVYFGEVYGNEKMVVLIFSWSLMKEDTTLKKWRKKWAKINYVYLFLCKYVSLTFSLHTKIKIIRNWVNTTIIL